MDDRHRPLTVMFTDIQGFSAMMSADEATTVRVVREHRVIVRASLARFGGREMRTVGDAFLVLFEDARAALECAEDIQAALAARNASLGPAEQVWVRIGLHAGTVLVGGDGELYGEAVNVAARVEPFAQGGGICATQAVLDEASANAAPPRDFAAWEDLGCVPLKNIPQAFRLRRRGGRGDSTGFGDAAPVGNVPAERVPVLGRARELETLRAWLVRGERVVTLVGPGGAGKTTLLESLGRELGPGWSGGVWFVALADVSDADGVARACAHVLGVAAGDDTAAALGRALGARGPTLLLLDNAEQVVAGVAALVDAWRAAAPALAVVTSSREALALHGERVLPVSGLARPDAVRLFVDRARAVRPDFEPAFEPNGPIRPAALEAIEALVERLDRLPLALELVASRLRFEPLERVRAALDGHLDVRARRRDGSPRQATLRATIAWSWDRLAEAERTALARLTVFRGGIPWAAAFDVAGPEGEACVEGLVDKSLAFADEAGLRLYESVRAFAAEHLAQDDPAPLRHATHFAGRCADPNAPDLAAVSENLASAFRFARAAGRDDLAAPLWLAWSGGGRAATPVQALLGAGEAFVDLADPALAARVLGRRIELLTANGRAQEAWTLVPMAVERADAGLSPDDRAELLCIASDAAFYLAKMRDAAPLLEAALGSARTARLRARCRARVFWVRTVLDPTHFERHIHEAEALARDPCHEVAHSMSHNLAVTWAGRGDVAGGVAALRALVATVTDTTDGHRACSARAILALAEAVLGDHVAARADAVQAAAMARALGYTRWEVVALAALGVSQAALGESAGPATARRGVELARVAGDPFELGQALLCVAWACALSGAREQAQQAFAEVEADFGDPETRRYGIFPAVWAATCAALGAEASGETAVGPSGSERGEGATDTPCASDTPGRSRTG